MNILSSLCSLMGLNRGGSESTNNHVSPIVKEDVPSQDYNVRMVTMLHNLCSALPEGAVLVDMKHGEFNLCVRWNADAQPQTEQQEHLVFSLESNSNAVTIYKEVEEDENKTEVEKTASQQMESSIISSQPVQKVEQTIQQEAAREQRREERKEQRLRDSMSRLEEHLQTHYDFRYNLLTEQTECARTTDENTGEEIEQSKRTYRTVDKRLMNTVTYGVVKGGLSLWDKDVSRIVESSMTREYHPFQLYFDNLPEWDGKDRVSELARRVSDSSLWTKSFHRWMLATVAQWMDRNDRRANSVAPILISTRQGWGKSTFCRMLLPTELQRYFTESYDLNAQSSAETKLATCGLINLDEFDKLSVKKMPLLKNLMQMESLNIRKAYKKSSEPLNRIASFIGTSNRRDLLTDSTGSRRFICVELEHEIDCSPIEYEQLYAQLKHELDGGERYWFTKSEENEIQKHNEAYYRNSPEEEVFNKCFTVSDNGRVMTATEVYEVMRKAYPAAMRGVSIHALSRLLPTLAPRVHTRYCNGYQLEMISPEVKGKK